jgi:hypothetical protein
MEVYGLAFNALAFACDCAILDCFVNDVLSGYSHRYIISSLDLMPVISSSASHRPGLKVVPVIKGVPLDRPERNLGDPSIEQGLATGRNYLSVIDDNVIVLLQ